MILSRSSKLFPGTFGIIFFEILLLGYPFLPFFLLLSIQTDALSVLFVWVSVDICSKKESSLMWHSPDEAVVKIDDSVSLLDDAVSTFSQ